MEKFYLCPAMATKLFNPFLDFKFDNTICFLTGQTLQSEEEKNSGVPIVDDACI
jgi:hypothetical protein